MKNKFLFSICLVLLFVVIFFVQIYIIDGKTLFGAKPNMILISIIVFTLFTGIYKGTLYSFLVGIISDFLYGSTYGVFTTSYVVLAIIIGIIEKNYRKENKTTLLIITFIGTAIFEIIQYIIYSILCSAPQSIFFLIKQILIASLLNMIVIYILNGIVQKIVEYFEIKVREKEAL